MKKIFCVLEYMLAIFIILDCRSVFQHTVSNSNVINIVLSALIFCLVMLNILAKRYDKNKVKKAILFFMVYYLYMALFVLLNDMEGMKNYIYAFGMILPLLFFYYYTSKETKQSIIKMLEKISNIMIVIAIVSVILYLLGPIFNIIKPTGSIYMKWGGERAIPSYYNLQFVTQNINIFGINIIRNTSIFTEAPMYSLNLSIALAIQMMSNPSKNSFIKKLILVITIITTTSTTGIIIATELVFFKILLQKSNKRIVKITKSIWFPIICIILFSVTAFFYDFRSETNSYSIRMDDYKASYQAWLEHPIVGNGYGSIEEIEEYMSGFRMNNTGLSNSILVLLAQCGIYWGIIYIIPFILAMVYGMKNQKSSVIIFAGTIMILFITAIFQYTVMMLNLLAIGYSLMGIGKQEEREMESFILANNER